MRFDIEVRPYHGEIFSSWFLRTAIANGTDPKSFALAIWEQNSLWYKDLDRFLPHDLIATLSQKSILSQEEIRSLTLEPIIKRLAPDELINQYKWGFLLPLGQKGSVRTNGLYFCPKCLAIPNPYIKKEWKFAWCIACSTHKIKLLLACERCNHIFSPHAVSYEQVKIFLCTNCGYDLRKSKTYAIDDNALEVQKTLSSIAFSGAYNQIYPFQCNNSKDFFLTLHIFFSFLTYIYKHEKYDAFFQDLGVLKNHQFSSNHNTTFARLGINDKEFLFCTVHQLFKKDLDVVISLLQKNHIRQRILKRTHKYVSPTVKRILSHLESSQVKKPPRKVFKKIKPKTKTEVDLLFESIQEFLYSTTYETSNKRNRAIPRISTCDTALIDNAFGLFNEDSFLLSKYHQTIKANQDTRQTSNLLKSAIDFIQYCEKFKDSKPSMDILEGYLWIYPQQKNSLTSFINFLSLTYSCDLNINKVPKAKLQRPKGTHQIYKNRLIKILQNPNDKFLKKQSFFRIVFGYLHWVSIPNNVYIDIKNIKKDKNKNFYIQLCTQRSYLPKEIIEFIIHFQKKHTNRHSVHERS